ncbi:uncharacterized protein FOMMEDRAFT_37360, partial [Fomitiporia mediterranea MF3/22]|uniref:uncharacterized protein n=1 Tax=Fomitiporia mediterranea (strain MF3/22) TaxID=694068 RepID=UPI0004407853
GMHSLAHELAAALMPEPSAGSKLLQEEFGIEYDEGAEGIDEEPELNGHAGGESLADEIGDAYDGPVPNGHAPELGDEPPIDDLAVHFGSGVSSSPGKPQAKQQPQQDPMDVLAKDLESTDKFLSQLRHLDADSTHSSSSQPSIEKFASDIIRHINDSVRDRESQVRELLEYEREFRKIAGEVNGNDVLGKLDALKEVDGLSDKPGPVDGARSNGVVMETIQEDTRAHQRASSNDWEMNPDDHFLEDEGDETFDEDVDTPSPMKDSFVVPPPMTGPPTVPKIIPELVHVRTVTTSLATSLTAISEHAQMNGAANADAGRKIRALKNKLGGWRSEWDSAEQSRLKIERWEAGLDGDDNNKRTTDEHLRAFELALADAGMKTQAIMAKS